MTWKLLCYTSGHSISTCPCPHCTFRRISPKDVELIKDYLRGESKPLPQVSSTSGPAGQVTVTSSGAGSGGATTSTTWTHTGCTTANLVTTSYKPSFVPPTTKAEVMSDQVDIEVGRHALRAFKLRYDQKTAEPLLGSLFKSTSWDGGTMIAECLNSHQKCEEVPGLHCHCGLYGALTLDHLMRDYRDYTLNGVAVIAAEGMTLIGTRGMRTSAARVVAYWAGNVEYAAAFVKQCPEAKHFTSMKDMLAEYNLPEYKEEFPPPPPPVMEFLPVKTSKINWKDIADKVPGLSQNGINALKHIGRFY